MRPNVKLRRQNRRYSLAGSHESQSGKLEKHFKCFSISSYSEKMSNFLLGCSESEI